MSIDNNYPAGYAAGQTSGYNTGYAAGQTSGYNTGYAAGQARMIARRFQESITLDVVPVRTFWENRDWSFDEFCVPTELNGYSYKVIEEGHSGATEPNWPTTLGATVQDGHVLWQCWPEFGTYPVAVQAPYPTGWATAFCYIDLPEYGRMDMEIRVTYNDDTTGYWMDLYGSMDETFVWMAFFQKSLAPAGQIKKIELRWKDGVEPGRYQYPLIVEATGLQEVA